MHDVRDELIRIGISVILILCGLAGWLMVLILLGWRIGT